MPMKAFLSACMHGCLLLMIWEDLRVYNARKKRQMDILSGLSANGAVMKQEAAGPAASWGHVLDQVEEDCDGGGQPP